MLNCSSKRLRIALSFFLFALFAQLYFPLEPGDIFQEADTGHTDMSLRNDDFPNPFISLIHVDLSSPNHSVSLTWQGQQAAVCEIGPFHSCPGGGRDGNDCDDISTSKTRDTYCTPKGIRTVEAFSDAMRSSPYLRFVTWFDLEREVGFHTHADLPNYSSSLGCVRLGDHAAQLIHNNSIAGKTEVLVEGTSSRPPPEETRKKHAAGLQPKK